MLISEYVVQPMQVFITKHRHFQDTFPESFIFF